MNYVNVLLDILNLKENNVKSVYHFVICVLNKLIVQLVKVNIVQFLVNAYLKYYVKEINTKKILNVLIAQKEHMQYIIKINV